MTGQAQILLLAQLALAGMLVWTCFCRIVKTDSDTHREVRWAIVFEGLAGGLVFLAPFLPMLMPDHATWRPWRTPQWVWLTLLGSVALVQLVTAKYWAAGHAPQQFQRRSTIPHAGGGVFAALLIVLAVTVHAPSAFAQDEPKLPVYPMEPGDLIRCGSVLGCVGMSVDVFEKLLAMARASGEQSCRKGRPTL
jgi:hypothetical protein